MHLAFVTRYRRGVFGDDMVHLCEKVMRKACADFGADLGEFNRESGHMHLLVNYPPKASVSARLLRSEYTGRVNRPRMNGHFWSPSCFAASCGGASPSIMQRPA